MKKIVTTFLIFLGVINLCISQDALIINGDIVNSSEYDKYEWMAMFSSPSNSDFPQFSNIVGTGTLIASDWVLTAAHVTHDEADLTDSVYFKNYILSNPFSGFRKVGIDTVIIRSDYTDNYMGLGISKYDVALIKLSEPVNDIPPLRISAHSLQSNDPLEIVGWGIYDQLSSDNIFPSDTLRHGIVKYIPNGVAAPQFTPFPLTDYEMCAGFVEGDFPVVGGFGDSGSPLLFEENGELVQIGITSFGSLNITWSDEANSIGYVDLTNYIQWIEDETGILIPVNVNKIVPIQENFELVQNSINKISIRYKGYEPLEADISIFSLNGQIEYRDQYTFTAGELWSIDEYFMTSGIKIISFEIDDVVINFKAFRY